MEAGFESGDKVRLVSGGPDMTVRGIHYDVLANEYRQDMLDCIWFDFNKDGKREVRYCPFYNYELVKINDPGNGPVC